MKDKLRMDLARLLRKEQLPLPQFDYWYEQHLRLDAAWEFQRVAAHLDVPPFIGGSITCQSCGKLQKEWDGTTVRLVRKPNLEYSPDLVLHNRIVAAGWKVFRVDRPLIANHPGEFVEALREALSSSAQPTVPKGINNRNARCMVVGWWLAKHGSIHIREAMEITGANRWTAWSLLKAIGKDIPLENNNRGTYRLKGEHNGKG